MRVCQFRHDGNSGLQGSGGREAAELENHFYSTVLSRAVKRERMIEVG
jgi:hypothetical protein